MEQQENPRVFKEGRKGICPHVLFFGWLRELEGLFARVVMGSTHVNGLRVNEGHIGVNERVLTVMKQIWT